MTPLWQLKERKHFERHESTMWLLRSNRTSNHTQHRMVAIAGSQDPQGRFMPFKVLTFVQLPRGSHRKLCTIVAVVLRYQHSHQGVMSEPHVWRAQRHEQVIFWDQINNQTCQLDPYGSIELLGSHFGFLWRVLEPHVDSA